MSVGLYHTFTELDTMNTERLTDVQRIFNKVIEANIYHVGRVRMMCWALRVARDTGVITAEDETLALHAINEYLQDFVFLAYALESRGMPCTFEDRLKLYQDWENRPKLTH